MTEWNSSADLMARIQASIEPVQTDEPLRQVLTQDFPRDCYNLPISGGWGYTRADAIIFVRDQFRTQGKSADFVGLEYHIAQKIIYEELIIFQPPGHKSSGIELHLILQKLTRADERRYDVLKFNVTCWSDWHWDQLKKEWEDNDFGRLANFDRQAHDAKRKDSRVEVFGLILLMYLIGADNGGAICAR